MPAACETRYCEHLAYVVRASVQQKLGVNIPDSDGLDKITACNPDRMNWSVQIGLPEIQKTVQEGKVRRNVNFLPDKGLQKVRIVGQQIDNFGRCQFIILRNYVHVQGSFSGLDGQ